MKLRILKNKLSNPNIKHSIKDILSYTIIFYQHYIESISSSYKSMMYKY